MECLGGAGLAGAVVLLEDLEAFTVNVQRCSASQREDLSILVLITEECVDEPRRRFGVTKVFKVCEDDVTVKETLLRLI